MKFPENLKYTKNDEWIKVEGEIGIVGITDYAQDSLSDIVFVELPEVGDHFSKGEPFGTVESVKAASDVYAPVGGEVVEVNDSLTKTPELVNKDPYEGAWMIKIKIDDMSELDDLMDVKAYKAYCSERSK